LEFNYGTLGLAAILLVIAMVILFVLIIVACAKALRIIKENHESTWRELGSPTLVLNNSISNNFRFYRYFMTRRYRELGDQELDRIGNRLIWLGVAYLFVAAGLFVSVWLIPV